MKTTLDLPDLLMRRVKIRAASEGRKLKEIIADLLEAGLAPPPPVSLEDAKTCQSPFVRDPQTGFLVSRRLGPPGQKKVSLAESLAMIEQANVEEDLRHVGLLR